MTELTLRFTGEVVAEYDAVLVAIGAQADQAAFVTAEPWTYVFDEAAGRFRDVRSGAFISAETMRQLRDGFVESRRAAVADLARQLSSGSLSLDEWEAAMRGEMKMILGVEYSLGRGGMLAMGADDWAALETLVQSQWGYLDGFARALESGQLSPAQLVSRADQYVNAGVQAYEQGQAAAWDVEDDLPGFPGDGTCDGLTNCRCAWLLSQNDDGTVDAYWDTEDDQDVCDPCAKHGDDWSPITVGEPTAGFSITDAAPELLTEQQQLLAYVRANVDAVGAVKEGWFAGQDILSPVDVRFDDGHWVTLDGTHVYIGAGESTAAAVQGIHDSAAAHEWGKQAFAKWREGLTPKQVDELKLYQSSGYHGLNEALRSRDKEMLADRSGRIQTMDAALAHAFTDKPLTVYRLVENTGTDEETGKSTEGTTALMGIKPGSTFTDPGYVSTAIDARWIDRFGPSTGEMPASSYAVASIQLPAHTHAAYLGGSFLSGSDERELLIARGATFKVLSHSEVGGVPHVALELVNAS